MQKSTAKLIKKLKLTDQRELDRAIQSKLYMQSEKSKLKRSMNGFKALMRLKQVFGINKK